MTEDKYYDLKLNNQLCFPLYAASKEVIKRYAPALKKLDLTYTQYIVMLSLWEFPPLSVKDLGEKLFLDSGTLTPVLKTLEAKGLIVRSRSAADERVVEIALTRKGKDLKDRALAVPLEMKKCHPLTSEESQTLYELLYKLLKTT
ncbi:MAG: MarR family transcriptional regulator [Clostridia bacterium]|nr:MarR family transcriptional regulator [Clostridia bacterium]